MGSSLCTLGGVGRAHFFQTQNPEPDPDRRSADDLGTPAISWPNYHSGRNGDFQRIRPLEPFHELLKNPDSPRDVIEYFPSHPHEGAVGVPEGETAARVIAAGMSLATGRSSTWRSRSNERWTPTATSSDAPSPSRAFTIFPTTTGTRPAALLRS